MAKEAALTLSAKVRLRAMFPLAGMACLLCGCAHSGDQRSGTVLRYVQQVKDCQATGEADGLCMERGYDACASDKAWGGDLSLASSKCAVPGLVGS